MTFFALAAITSCIKDEVKEVNKGTEIGFRTALQTKGMEADSWTLETIYVTALEEDGKPYFSEVAFAKTGNSDGYFSTSPAYYWPGDGRTFDFYAYSPSEEELGGTVEISNETKKLTGFTTKPDIWDQVDFITAKAVDQTEENNTGSIGLTFNHHLTRVMVYASTNTDEYEYIVNGVRFADIWSTGDFNFETETWDLTGYADEEYLKTFEMELDEPVTLSRYSSQNLTREIKYKNGTEDNSAFFIPQTITSWDPEDPAAVGSYISINVQINKKHDNGSVTRIYPATDAGDYGWVAVPLPENTEWKAGEFYRYYLNFGRGAGYVDPLVTPSGGTILGETIKMTIKVEDWVDSEENTLKNIEMIGKWTATKYYEAIEEDVLQDDGSYQVKERTRYYTEDNSVIAGYIDNFAEITIEDGTKLITKLNGVNTETPYILDENRYILIEVYQSKDSNGDVIEGEYDVLPQIINITPASAEPYQLGSAEIHVLQTEIGTQGTGNYYKRTQVIIYDIEPLSI